MLCPTILSLQCPGAVKPDSRCWTLSLPGHFVCSRIVLGPLGTASPAGVGLQQPAIKRPKEARDGSLNRNTGRFMTFLSAGYFGAKD